MNFKTCKNYCYNPRLILNSIIRRNARFFKDDKFYLSLRWWCMNGYWLDWKHPKTFCEKLQWLKVYDRNPLYTNLVDKFEVKKYIADVIGEEYIIPTLGIWERAEDIDFDSLPDKFVLKTTHGSGSKGIIICTNKLTFNKIEAIHILNKIVKQDTYISLREWPYKNVPKRIMAEQFIENGNNETCLTDYKFFCFNGEPRYCQVIKDRDKEETIDFFDMNWQHQEFIGLNPIATHAIVCPNKPENFETMFKLAYRLSKGLRFSRIDFYNINGKIYFGEITFFPASGIGIFNPSCWDKKLGEMLIIENVPIQNNDI